MKINKEVIKYYYIELHGLQARVAGQLSKLEKEVQSITTQKKIAFYRGLFIRLEEDLKYLKRINF